MITIMINSRHQCQCVRSVNLDPREQGALRIHLAHRHRSPGRLRRPIAIRQLRSDYGIPPGAQIQSAWSAPAGDGSRARSLEALVSERGTIEQLTRSRFATDGASGGDRFVARNVLASGATVSVVLEGVIDVAKECARVRAELAQTEKLLAGVVQRLSNEGFVSRAPANVIEGARQQQRDLETKRRTQLDQVATLCGS